MAKDSGQRFTIRAGSKPVPCRGPHCGRPIYFAYNPATQRSTPVDLEVPDAVRPSALGEKDRGQLDVFSGGETEIRDGLGGSHFDRCPDAEWFRQQHAERRARELGEMSH